MKTKKNALASTTIVGLITAALGTGGAVPAAVPHASTWDLVLQIVGLLVALWGRWKQGDLVLGKSPPVPPALLVLCALGVGTFSGCAAPTSEQGRASQGGTIDRAPVTNVSFSFLGPVWVHGTTGAPTAAPSAASEAQSRQDARTDTSVPIDASGVIPAAGAGKVLGAIKAPAAPVVIPAEIVVPAPVPAPAPTVPAVDAPVPPPPAPIGGTSALRGLETNNG